MFVNIDEHRTAVGMRQIALAYNAAADLTDKWAGVQVDTAAALSEARHAVLRAYQATAMAPGNAGDYVRAALDSIDDDLAVLR